MKSLLRKRSTTFGEVKKLFKMMSIFFRFFFSLLLCSLRMNEMGFWRASISLSHSLSWKMCRMNEILAFFISYLRLPLIQLKALFPHFALKSFACALFALHTLSFFSICTNRAHIPLHLYIFAVTTHYIFFVELQVVGWERKEGWK
jgi:hypothetical protein